MIIDSLTHITTNGEWFGTGLDASRASLLSAMDEDGVDMAVVAGIPGQNDDGVILETARQHPGRFLPVAGVDASLPERELEARMESVRDKGFLGVKLHPRISGISLAAPEMRHAVDLAGRHGLTAMICTIHRPPLPPLGRPISDAIHALCSACENSRIVLVHGGYTDLLATSEIVRPMEHVLLDLSLTATRFADTSIGRDIEWLMRTFDRRICIGSDFPEGNMKQLTDLWKGRVGVESMKNILETCANNVLRFFGQETTPGPDPFSSQ